MARKQPGKYDAVMPGLPPLPADDASYQDRVNGVKEKVTVRDAEVLAATYTKLRAAKDEANKVLSAINLQIAAYEQLLEESKDAKADGWGLHGVKPNAFRLASGETIRVQKEPVGKVVDREAFRLWCMAPADRCITCSAPESALCHQEGADMMLAPHEYKPGGGYERQLSLHPGTMNTLVKERLLAGEEPPDGTEAYSYTKVMFVKAGAE